MKKNKGYTLIELIIVIAIIAVLSGVSLITLGIIKQAQYNTAATTLSDQMGSLLVKTKALSDPSNQPLCMAIQQNVATVTYADGNTAKAGSYSVYLGNNTGSSFVAKSANTAEATLPNIITIQYVPSDASQKASFATDNYFVIQYNKADSSVKYGAGTYNIIYNGRTVASVYLDKATGNHYVE